MSSLQSGSIASPTSVNTIIQQLTAESNAPPYSIKGYIKFVDPGTAGPPLSGFYSPQTSLSGRKAHVSAPVSTNNDSMTVYQAKSRPDLAISYRLEGPLRSDIRPVGTPANVTLASAWIITKFQPNGQTSVVGAWIQRPVTTLDGEERWTLIGDETQSLPPIFVQEADDSGTLQLLAVFVRDAQLDIPSSQLPPDHTHSDHCSNFVFATELPKGHEVSTDWTPHLSRLGTSPPVK
jgi:hypothetical protein